MRTRFVNTHEAILRPTLKLRLQPNNARRLPFQPLGLMAINDFEQVFFGILHRFCAGLICFLIGSRPFPSNSPMNRLETSNSEGQPFLAKIRQLSSKQTFTSIPSHIPWKHVSLPTKLPQTPTPEPPTFFQRVTNFLLRPVTFLDLTKRTPSVCSDIKAMNKKPEKIKDEKKPQQPS